MFWKLKNTLTLIVIAPLSWGLYHVRVYSPTPLNGIGPLVDGCVVSKDVLGRLVRETAVTVLERELIDKPSPKQIRQEFLERIYQNFRRIGTLENFYVTQFCGLAPDQNGPSINSAQIGQPPRQSVVPVTSIRTVEFAAVAPPVATQVPSTPPRAQREPESAGTRNTVRKPAAPVPGSPGKPAPPSRAGSSPDVQAKVITGHQSTAIPYSERVEVPSAHQSVSFSSPDSTQNESGMGSSPGGPLVRGRGRGGGRGGPPARGRPAPNRGAASMSDLGHTPTRPEAPIRPEAPPRNPTSDPNVSQTPPAQGGGWLANRASPSMRSGPVNRTPNLFGSQRSRTNNNEDSQ